MWRRKVVLSNDSQLKGKDVYECDNVGEGEEIESERGKGKKDTEILKAEQRERHNAILRVRPCLSWAVKIGCNSVTADKGEVAQPIVTRPRSNCPISRANDIQALLSPSFASCWRLLCCVQLEILQQKSRYDLRAYPIDSFPWTHEGICSALHNSC